MKNPSFELLKPYFITYKKSIIIGILSLIIVDLLQLFIPRIIKWAVDDLTAYRIDNAGLLRYALMIIVISILMVIFRYLWRFCLIGLSRRVEEGLRNLLFEHVQTLSASYFSKVKTGDIMAHATNDINHIRMATGMGIVALADSIFLGTSAIAFMAYIHIELTALVLIPMPLIALCALFFSKRMHMMYQQVQASFSNLTEEVRERFSGIRVIKAYGMESESIGSVDKLSQEYVKKNIQLVKITGAFFPLMVLISNISLALVIGVGGWQTIRLKITPGDFVAFISYLGLLTWPMMAIGWVTNLIQRGKASLDRIHIILQTRPEIQDPIDGIEYRNFQKGIEFDNVYFQYHSDSPSVLNGIRLFIKKGETIGIIGPPGAGKSTVLNLLPRLYDVTSGRILIDGIDIRSIRLSALRSMISLMHQEPFLFAGTIRDNITFGDPNVSLEAIDEAAKLAAIYDTIQSFPNGYDTIVGEKGIVLSGGQKQRIALARALLRKTPILILDDPISQVDMETGDQIIRSIRSVSHMQTIIIVSHRLSAVRFADKIIMLDKGQIAESGTHDELIKNDTYYARTWRLQEIEEELHAF